MSVGVGDILRISANMLARSLHQQVNVWHFQVGANTHPSDVGVMTDIAAQLDTAYAVIVPSLSDIVSFVDVQGQNLTKSELLPPTPWPTLTAGGNPVDALPEQVAPSVFWGTIVPGVVGRKFLPTVVDTAHVGGLLSSGLQTQLASFAATFLVPLVTSNLTITAGAWNPGLARFTTFNSANVPTRPRTQRRRRPGVGS